MVMFIFQYHCLSCYTNHSFDSFNYSIFLYLYYKYMCQNSSQRLNECITSSPPILCRNITCGLAPNNDQGEGMLTQTSLSGSFPTFTSRDDVSLQLLGKVAQFLPGTGIHLKIPRSKIKIRSLQFCVSNRWQYNPHIYQV